MHGDVSYLAVVVMNSLFRLFIGFCLLELRRLESPLTRRQVLYAVAETRFGLW